MQMVAGRLDSEQIDALAAFFFIKEKNAYLLFK